MLSRKYLIIYAALWMAFTGAQAQSNTSSAKSNFKLFFEKVYLHTDRDIYVKSDTLWFKAYLTDAQSNKPVNTSGTLYVDLVAPDAHIITTELVRLTNGLGNADIELTDTLAPGKYHLRAYTNWMKNFGDAFIFDKQITIAGTQPDVRITAGTKPQKEKKLTPLPLSSPRSPTLQFFPEGGSMVAGASSFIGVKAEDANGKGIPASGAVLSSSGDTVARFKCNDLGMGLLVLLPVKGETYTALANVGTKHLSLSLPAALTQGLALQVKQTDSLLYVVISNSEAIPTPYVLTVKHAGQVIINQQIATAGQQTATKIPTRDLPEGIAVITLYDAQGKPNCERLVYIHHPDLDKVTIHTDKKTYSPFERTNVQVDVGSGTANLSVVVVDANVVPQQADDILSYLMLGSELRGRVEQTCRYFDDANPDRFKQLDMLLLTQGWRDYTWRKLGDTAIRVSYAPENGITLSGFVKDEVNHKALPGLNVSLYASELEGTKLFATHSDAKGHFVFTGLNFYDKLFTKLTSVNVTGDNKGTFYMDTIATLPVKAISQYQTDNTADTEPTQVAAMLKKASTANKLKGVTNLKEVQIKANKNFVTYDNGRKKLMTWGEVQTFDITPKDSEYRTLAWYLQQKDKRAVLNDAKRPGVAYIIDGHKVQPILIVNGSSFHIDKELYFNMPIEKFKHIDVYPLQGAYLISVVTKQPNPLVDNPGYLTLDSEGYYQARAFYKPVYEGETAPPKTDMRTTIHWQPYLKTDINGKASFSFYNTSGSTTASIIIQGIKADGTPISQVLNYEVK